MAIFNLVLQPAWLDYELLIGSATLTFQLQASNFKWRPSANRFSPVPIAIFKTTLYYRTAFT